MTPIRLVIMGIDGNMGRHIGKLALNDPDFQIVGGYTIPSSPNIGRDIGEILGAGKIGIEIKSSEDAKKDWEENAPDCIIDFTTASATEHFASLAAQMKIPVVVGTTGMSDTFYKDMDSIVKEKCTAAVIASNMATGVNIFFKIAAEITKYVKDWDIEIIEYHHHRKRDSPSGTALTVAKNISQVLGKELDDIAKYGRDKGPNKRKIGADEIGIHAIRAGDIVGEHIVLYAGTGERIELTHRAHSRECFASGALRAAKFLMTHSATGKIYDMQDVLGLK